jgi:murein DD-endopeptidase MepM/ murein hydrolase activator NlpD
VRTAALALVLLTACSGRTNDPAAASADATTTPTSTPTTSAASTTIAATVPAAPTAAPTLVTASTTSTTSTTVAPTLPAPTTTPYGVPVASASASWGRTHSGYPATDIFVGCGAGIISPVNGVLTEVRRDNHWDPAVDDPATRGGRSIAMIGDDGVRYYFAHFDTIDEALAPGQPVVIGQPLGTMGMTGRASACHLHFGISPPCAGPEWSVRRGVIWPYRYLDAWRNGEQLSPVDEIREWSAANPTACEQAMADPNAGDS